MKGIPCSKGKRVERKSKHALNQVTPLKPDSPAASSQQTQFDRDLDQWVFLLSYHQIISEALKRLHYLERTSTEPFLDRWWNEAELLQALKGTKTIDLSSFAEDLSIMLLKAPSQVLSPGLPSDHSSSNILSIWTANALANLDYERRCPICHPSHDQDNLTDLQKRGAIGSEFLARRNRLLGHCRDSIHRHGVSSRLVKAELNRFLSLVPAILDKVCLLLKNFDLPDFAKTGLYYPDELVYEIVHSGEWLSDCLQRTPVHQWLDAVTHTLTDTDTQILQQSITMTDLNQQDVLGRSLLHIACQKAWTGGVKALLHIGADPKLPTCYGHLPLHYAAANGSSYICKLLLDAYNGEYDLGRLDCHGNSALYYSIASKDRATIKLLLSEPHKIDPNRYGEGDTNCLPPLLKAVHENDKELVEILLNAGASTSLFYGPSAWEHYALLKLSNENDALLALL
ncbi:Nn.00g065060.m01.CDS01 [Neocucurbitaria sp. VM-36]